MLRRRQHGCRLGGFGRYGIEMGRLCRGRPDRHFRLCFQFRFFLCGLIAEEGFGVFAVIRTLHETHPDGQGRFRSGFLFSQRFAAVVAHPYPAGHRRRETKEPGIGVVAGRAGLAA